MQNKSHSELQLEYHEAKGAFDVLVILREEFEQWVEEAQDDSKHEALENVLGHVEALESEYKRRFEAIQQKIRED